MMLRAAASCSRAETNLRWAILDVCVLAAWMRRRQHGPVLSTSCMELCCAEGRPPGGAQAERHSLREVLEDLLDALVSARLLRGPARVVDAKVPIIKCHLAMGNSQPCMLQDLAIRGCVTKGWHLYLRIAGKEGVHSAVMRNQAHENQGHVR